MSALEKHLLASVRQLVLDHLPYDRSDADVVRELAAMTPCELVARWLNWTWRIPPATPRLVFQSREFSSNPILIQHHDDINALTSDIQSGADLTKYLSKFVKHGYVNATGMKLHRRQDLDLMLSAWGIHHLHFSQEVGADGFVKRDGSIVFVAFKADKAYLIDIMTHRDWAREHVIRVLVNNWPDEGLVYEVKGVEGLAQPRTDDERQKLRNAQINTMLEIDGKVYWPRGGMSTAGLSIDAVREADQTILDLEAFALQFENNPETILSSVPNGTFPDRPNLAVTFRRDGYGVSELISNTYFRLGPL